MKKFISIFNPITKSSTCKEPISVEDALKIIKGEDKRYLHYINKARAAGKGKGEKKYKIYKKDSDDQNVQLYDYIKSTKIDSFCWPLSLKQGEKRNLREVREEALSDYMYFDVDDIFVPLPLETIKDIVFSIESVKAVWKSLSNAGLGFIIEVRGVTKENAKATWVHNAITVNDLVNEHIKLNYTDLCYEHNQRVEEGKVEKGEKGVYFKVDPSVKDYTRLNVISYDPDVRIRDDKDVKPASAINKATFDKLHPQKKQSVKLTTNRVRKDISDFVNKNALKTPTELEKMHLEFTYTNLYEDKDRWKEGRLAYLFYRDYFAASNKMGIEFDVAFNFLAKKKEENPDLMLFEWRDEERVYNGVGSDMYTAYESQFGSAIHENENYDGYDIIDINVPFKGTYRDAQFFMNYLHYDISRKSPFNEKNIYHFVKAVKEKGISFSNMLSFLVEKNTNEKVMNKAKWVYSNTFIAFGIILKEKEENKKKRLDESNLIATSQNKRIIYLEEHKSNDIKYFSDLSFSKKPEQSLHYYIKRSIKYALDKEVASHYVTNLVCYEDVSIGVEAIFDYIILELDYRRGVIYESNKQIEYSEFLKYTNTYTLEKDQYLKDLNLNLSDREIIYSSTGSGKTTLFLSKDAPKCIFLVPTTALADTNGQKPGVKPYYEKKKKFTLKDKIVCTYSSLPSLIKDIIKLGGNPYEYHLIVDEAHNLVASASDNFRLKEMTYIYNMMDKFEKVVHLTGTWFNIIAPRFKDYKITRVTKHNPQQFKYIRYKDKHVAVEKLCKKDGLNIIFLQSKKFEKQLGTYTEYFKMKGWDENEMLFLNAGTKDEIHIKRLLKKKQIPEKYKVVFITSFAAEGLDLYNENVETLHFASDEHPMMMQQIANRFRHKAPNMIYLYKSVDKQYTHMEFEGRMEDQFSLENAASQTLDIVNNPKNKPYFGMFFSMDYFNELNDGGFELNYLTIANAVYNKEKTYANNNESYMVNALEYYGWNYHGETILEKRAEKQIEKALKSYRKIEKEKVYEEQKNIFEGIKKNESLVQISQIVEKGSLGSVIKDSKLPDFEFSVRKKILRLAKYVDFNYALDVVEKWLINTGASAVAWKRMMGAFELAKRKRFDFYDGAMEIRNGFYEALKKEMVDVQKRGEKEKLYFDHHIISFVNNARIGSESYVPYVNTFKEALEVLSDYVFLEETVDTKGKRRVKFGQIKLINEENYLVNAIYHFANYHLKSGKTFTKGEFKEYLHSKRANLIFGSLENELNPESHDRAFEILQKFCNVESDGRRSYIVVNIGSNLLGDIKWRDDLMELYDEDKCEFLI